MKEAIYQYGAGLDWATNILPKLTNYRDEPYVPAKSLGTHFALPINKNMTVHVSGNDSKLADCWACNPVVHDANQDGKYILKAGSSAFNLAIFIKKVTLRDYFSRNEHYTPLLDSVVDLTQHTIVKFDSISNQASSLMNELKNTKATGPLYELMITSTVYGLLSEYFDQTIHQQWRIEQDVEEDIASIITSQGYLIDHIMKPFVGISTLAALAHMSETKYKRCFKKITGTTPNVFFITKKLSFVKEVLETGNFAIGEIAAQFNFTNSSHLIRQFKVQYGITPKEYLMYL